MASLSLSDGHLVGNALLPHIGLKTFEALEQTAIESSVSMADFPSAFDQAVEAYFAPNSIVRASVHKEISKLSLQDFRETQEPTSDRPTRPATAKLIHIIKTHRLRLDSSSDASSAAL
ncbi:hypothetical protein MIND_00920900 [Mycena indigotica]|uniref:Uncharacterized protein n=1 Tax=Mycena indigotica TaxID=2126181 RepID=A0A8H6SDT4_9AGAR|nr:uncharacterized protein MIND_00920900 [Mycena indigotica]KAF7296891.1 hypothetical protein MIND_00920900 [Mycena indigotica]